MPAVERLTPGETRLTLGGTVRFEPEWLPRPDADALLSELLTTIPWTQGTITLFGRDLPEPRLTAWFGDEDYTYSGRTLRAAPWPATLAGLKAGVEESAGVPFNAVLLNLYRGADDSMGLHSDDEPELGPDPTLASVSLGVARTFVLSPKRKSARRGGTYDVLLEHGSLLVMAGACQSAYRHGIPKERGRGGQRVNLTFRNICRPSSAP